MQYAALSHPCKDNVKREQNRRLATCLRPYPVGSSSPDTHVRLLQAHILS